MEIDVSLERLKFSGVLGNGFLGGPDCRLQSFVWVHIEAIQVLTETVEAIVTARDSVRVQRRYDLEDKVFTQLSTLLAL